VTRGTDLGGLRRKGFTGVGGSTAVQTERRGATVVEQRSTRGRRQGGRGRSRRRCGARGGVRGVRRGTEVAVCGGSTTAAQRRSGGEGAEEEKSCSSGGARFIAVRGESGAAVRLWAARWRWRSRGHGKAAAAAVGMSSARFGRRCPNNENDGGPHTVSIFFSKLSKLAET
jgi:hypothetical protein